MFDELYLLHQIIMIHTRRVHYLMCTVYIKVPLSVCNHISPLPDIPMSAPKVSKKKAKPIVQRNIPTNASVTIKAREFKRSQGSRLLSTTSLASSRSSTPLASQMAHDFSDEPPDTQLYSDVDDDLLESATKKERKGPSRSVSVSVDSRTPLLPSSPAQ